MYKTLFNEINEYNRLHLNEKRRKHVKGVVKTAEKLAKAYGVDRDKARIAAVSHDMFRWLKNEKLTKYVDLLGLDSKYRNNPNLAHSKLASCVLKRDYGVEDEDILNAVSYHTTGREGMSKLEQIIYLSDAIEPNRDYSFVDELRKTAYEDLESACLLSLKNTVRFLEEQGKDIDNDTLLAVKYFEHLKET